MTDTTANKTKRTLSGTVVSDKMNKTVTVLVTRYVKHPKYGKFMKKEKRYKAHVEDNSVKEGSKVTIEECRPISKDKRFKVVSVL